MNRRQVLRGALAAGLTTPALTALTDTRQSLDLALATGTAPADLSDLEAAAETYGYGYHGQPPTRVLADLVTDFADLHPMLAAPSRSPHACGPQLRRPPNAGRTGRTGPADRRQQAHRRGDPAAAGVGAAGQGVGEAVGRRPGCTARLR
ncbi:hypothetical protein [Streptomyces chryseus]